MTESRPAETVVQFIPHSEWHPGAPKSSRLLAVQCDASFADAAHARGGIHSASGTHRVDLAAVDLSNSAEAEFITLCLATLTSADQRQPLRIRCDNEPAVAAAQRLHSGQLPKWVRNDASDLAQRIVIAATTSVRLRPVEILHVLRDRVVRADAVASVNRVSNELMHPRNYARKQGMMLSWNDSQRGLDRPSGETNECPPSWIR
ncbi:hypothetical protein ACWGQT_00100 [Streptomyces yangpuensis]